MATIEEQVPQTELARGALSLFDTLSSTLANLAPVEGIFLAITLVVFAMGSMAPWAFLIAGIAILATGNTMSEFSQTIPSAGSFVTFIGRGMGARAPKTGSARSRPGRSTSWRTPPAVCQTPRAPRPAAWAARR